MSAIDQKLNSLLDRKLERQRRGLIALKLLRKQQKIEQKLKLVIEKK
jgi:hypothetical protein